MTEDAGSRWVALLGAASLHIAVGLVLLSAVTSGVPQRGKSENDRGRHGVIGIVQFERPGELQPPAWTMRSAKAGNVARQRLPADTQGGKAPATAGLDGAADVESGPSPVRPPAVAATADLPSAEVLAYSARLETHLARYRAYPAAARLSREQGVVVLQLVMNGAGEVIDVWVESSSGFASIDDEALAAATRAQPLPVFPTGWPERMSIAIPVIFRLD